MSQFVYQKLKTGIIERKLAPGQKLVENDISNSLSVSRTPIRQAFSKLQKEGFITIIPNRGAQVINPTIDEITDAFTHRKQLELLATMDIMEKIKQEDIDNLNILIQEEAEAFVKKDLVQYIHVNTKFHITLMGGCTNRFLKENAVKMINQTHIYLILYDHFYKIDEKNTRGSNEHKLMVNVIEKGDTGAFITLLDKHISSTIEEYKTRVKRFHHTSELFD